MMLSMKEWRVFLLTLKEVSSEVIATVDILNILLYGNVGSQSKLLPRYLSSKMNSSGSSCFVLVAAVAVRSLSIFEKVQHSFQSRDVNFQSRAVHQN